MLRIEEDTIYLTRGDTAIIQLTLVDSDENAYTPSTGDQIRFAMKRKMSDAEAILLTKEIDTSDLILTIDPEDTQTLSYSKSRPYKYDISLTYSGGEVDTFIQDADIYILPEADVYE